MKLIQSVKRRMASDLRPAGNRSVSPDARNQHQPRLKEEPNPFAGIPTLKEASAADRPDLFRKKLLACQTIYDFNQVTAIKEKEAKRQTLLELIDYVSQAKSLFTEPVMQDLVETVSINIFRTLPPLKQRNPLAIYDPEDEEPTLEPSYPHLQMIYELFLRFVISPEVDPKLAKKFIDQLFIQRFLDLFDSEDPRERDVLKTTLHRLYGKFMAHRAFIRKAIQNLFFKIIYESELHNGISELLEILGSIINGFALPLKDEHKQFLEKSLIPLHKVKTLNAFHQPLCYCMTQYAEKDPRLCEPIILGLLRLWPVTCSAKEVLFLSELEEILELTQGPEFTAVQAPLLDRFRICITSSQFQVAEKALFLWSHEEVHKLFMGARQFCYPIMISALLQNTKHHWNNQVNGLSYTVLRSMKEADEALYVSVEAQLQGDEDVAENEAREKMWLSLLGKPSSRTSFAPQVVDN